MTKTRNQLISMFQHTKQRNNSNAIKHIKHEDIDTTCQHLLEDKQEIEKLKKALDKAVGEIQKMIECNNCGSYETCPFDVEHECNHECENKYKLRDWVMKDD